MKTSPRRASYFGNASGKWSDVFSPVSEEVGCDPMLMRQCIAGHIYLSWTKTLHASHVTMPNIKTCRDYELENDWKEKKGVFSRICPIS